MLVHHLLHACGCIPVLEKEKFKFPFGCGMYIHGVTVQLDTFITKRLPRTNKQPMIEWFSP